MSEAPDLAGTTILVVEDDYFLAMDTAEALRGAGARVLGPVAREKDARAVLAAEAPTVAVLDLNLDGDGPRFDLARDLRTAGVSILVLTGYDPQTFPADLAGVTSLQKPVPVRQVLDAVAGLR